MGQPVPAYPLEFAAALSALRDSFARSDAIVRRASEALAASRYPGNPLLRQPFLGVSSLDLAGGLDAAGHFSRP
jgi:hypothetical protein